MTLPLKRRAPTQPLRAAQLVAPPELPDIEYLLEAQIKVDLSSWAAFDAKYDGRGGPLLVEIFHGAGLRLAYSSATITDRIIEFINYWRIGRDLNGLAQAEIKMSDNVVFAEFDKVVQRDEIKSIICELQTVGRPHLGPDFDPANTQYLRILYDVQPRGLEEFMARLESDVQPFGKEHGWGLGASHTYHVGRDGRAVQLWLVPKSMVLGDCEKIIGQVPWVRSVRGEPLLRSGTAPRASLHMLTDLDPHLQQYPHA